MVWLGALGIANALLAVVCVFGVDVVQQLFPFAPRWVRHALAALALLNISSIVALFEWKRWGFWGYSLSSFAMFFVIAWFNAGMTAALMAPVGVLLLYLALNLGQNKGSWPHLS